MRRGAPDGLPAEAILRLNLLTSALLTVTVGVGLVGYALATGRPTLLALLPLAVWIAAEKNGDVWLSLATADGRSHLATASILIRPSAVGTSGQVTSWAPSLATRSASTVG